MRYTLIVVIVAFTACGTSETQTDDVAVDASTDEASADATADPPNDRSDTTDTVAEDTSTDVDPLDIGNIATSCGSPMQDLVPVDCTRNGDVDSFCVFGNHCACSEGYECEVPFADIDGPECAAGSVCIPREP